MKRRLPRRSRQTGYVGRTLQYSHVVQGFYGAGISCRRPEPSAGPHDGDAGGLVAKKVKSQQVVSFNDATTPATTTQCLLVIGAARHRK